MQIALLILGIACLLYYTVLLVVGMDFSIVWLAGAVVCFALLFFIRHGKKHPEMHHLPIWIKITGGTVIAVGLLAFLGVEALIFSGMFQKGEQKLDYIIILGAQVKQEEPSRALKLRLDKAEEYLSENPETKAVLSGGQGPGEAITEAEAMRRYLVKKGIAEERLILEDQSTTTEENLNFSARLIGNKDYSVGIVTNNFHVYRGVQLGKKMGYTDICGIAAKTDPRFQVHYLVREFFAVVKEKLVGNI